MGKVEVRDIAELEFSKTFARCKDRGIRVSLTDRFKNKVLEEGYNPAYGARPLRRAIVRLLEDELAESFLTSPTVEGEYIICDLDKKGKVAILRHRPSTPERQDDGPDAKKETRRST